MTERDATESGPDVEAIIQQIRADVSASELPVDPAIAETAALDSDLNQILAEANRSCVVGRSRPSGARGFIYRILLRLLTPLVEDLALVADLNRFNSLSVRSLNKLSKMLTGNDTASDSDLLAQTRRRIDLLVDLGSRLDSYDKQQLDERLKRIEAQLGKSELQE
jgi:hypothetical protein